MSSIPILDCPECEKRIPSIEEVEAKAKELGIEYTYWKSSTPPMKLSQKTGQWEYVSNISLTLHGAYTVTFVDTDENRKRAMSLLRSGNAY